jgi:hypothetical protein
MLRRAGGWMRASAPFALTTVLTAILVVALAACDVHGTAAPAPTNTSVVSVEGDYVGEIAGLNAGIAITTDGNNALVYIGDGTPSQVTISAWMQGQDVNNVITITSSFNLEVSALLTTNSASGNVTITGSSNTYTFTATAVTSRGGPGVYQGQLTVEGVAYLGGWFVLPSGVATGNIPTMGGGVINQQTRALIVSPIPNYTTMTVNVPTVGAFTLHECHFGACS